MFYSVNDNPIIGNKRENKVKKTINENYQLENINS